ncbi:MAG: hypothetical protein QNJ72_18965 [Pleurocapsa sp. MO_226.B13]|nr:hypothetical protein [Pleurocapsa sp. MO_226.B13]
MMLLSYSRILQSGNNIRIRIISKRSPSDYRVTPLPRTIAHGVVVDRWIEKSDLWHLQHRIYQQISVNAAFLPDKVMREEAAKTTTD